MLNDEQKAELIACIETSLAELAKSMVSLKEMTKPIAPDRALGRIARADMMYMKNIHEANYNKAEFRCNQLKDALKRIDQPDFGMCQWCNQPIGMPRLLAMPESTQCIRCA
ncbi:MAG: TraR/DksA family transcriptional regulator [Candidatus Omnitrophica bacterium]|nr:TraR/DksA family transcriptional regulator [Candidatus Omnitrophota bacterium]